MDITIGCDPEAFVFSKKENRIVSAYGLIPGTKDKPFKVDNGAIQVDGMAVEFNINPAKNSNEFSDNVWSVIKQLKAHLGSDYNLVFKPVADFDPAYLEEQPPVAKMLGCDPDYNAYTGEVNPRPNSDLPMRTAAGHVHIGWTKDMDPLDQGHFEACCMLAKQLDWIMGLPYRGLDGPDQRRNEMYGNFGAFRPKPYGMEYRVPSNTWLNSVHTVRDTFSMAHHAFNMLMQQRQYYTEGDIRSVQPANYRLYTESYATGAVSTDTLRLLTKAASNAFDPHPVIQEYNEQYEAALQVDLQMDAIGPWVR